MGMGREFTGNRRENSGSDERSNGSVARAEEHAHTMDTMVGTMDATVHTMGTKENQTTPAALPKVVVACSSVAKIGITSATLHRVRVRATGPTGPAIKSCPPAFLRFWPYITMMPRPELSR